MFLNRRSSTNGLVELFFPMPNQRKLKLALLADASHVNCQRWFEGLSQAGADVHMISFYHHNRRDIPTYHLPVRRLPGKLHYFTAVPHLRKVLAAIKPDVVLAYYVTGCGTLGALADFHPLVLVTSGSDILVAPRNPIMKLLLRYNLGRADLVTAWAPHMARAAQALGVAEDRIIVLPRGIPFQQFARARCPVPEGDRAIRIICTRSLNPNYKIDRLLEAMSLLKQNGVEFSLTLAGDGTERARLVSLTSTLGLNERVRFAGFVPNDQLPSLLGQQDLYVSLIESDGVSASLLEGMAAGLFPIVPDQPANRFWITSGENGLLLGDISAAGVAAAITKAISDLSLRKRAWEQNSDKVRKHADLHRNSEIFLERFRELARNYRN